MKKAGRQTRGRWLDRKILEALLEVDLRGGRYSPVSMIATRVSRSTKSARSALLSLERQGLAQRLDRWSADNRFAVSTWAITPAGRERLKGDDDR